MDRHDLPIGVFDSGMGGLTVLRALTSQLPRESFLYLGDTARLPYGVKSANSVRRYAEQASAFLVRRGVKMLVVACNTVSAVALDDLRQRLAPLPVVGVIEPGARAACRASVSGVILVLGTERTVAEGAYEKAIASVSPGARVRSRACAVFVALAEEGWFDDVAAEVVARQYLAGWEQGMGEGTDCVVLGCTHFPVLRGTISRVVGRQIAIVDSASSTAAAVASRLARDGRSARRTQLGTVELMATDAAARFARVGARFLGRVLEPGEVELVDLGVR
ncbi:MAG: glutamate racemase [Nannocystaceae bacterium]